MKRENQAAHLLKFLGRTLAVAESCTGGCLAHRLTNVPGSSVFFLGGVIAYSNASKINLLKVRSSLLKQHGAVSEEIAMAMARGVRDLFHSDYGLAITGIAGPDGGTRAKPVGLTFIALTTENEAFCLQCHFQGDRVKNKTMATDMALSLLLEFLDER